MFTGSAVTHPQLIQTTARGGLLFSQTAQEAEFLCGTEGSSACLLVWRTDPQGTCQERGEWVQGVPNPSASRGRAGRHQVIPPEPPGFRGLGFISSLLQGKLVLLLLTEIHPTILSFFPRGERKISSVHAREVSWACRSLGLEG